MNIRNTRTFYSRVETDAGGLERACSKLDQDVHILSLTLLREERPKRIVAVRDAIGTIPSGKAAIVRCVLYEYDEKE